MNVLKMCQLYTRRHYLILYSFITTAILRFALSFGSEINITNLLSHYIRVCGVDHICDKSLLHITVKPDLEYNDSKLCPECKCDNLCLKYGDCCPDIFFSLPDMKCDSLYVLEPQSFLHLMKINASDYQIVSQCPPNADITMHTMCNFSYVDNISGQLTNIPVTGEKLNIAYRNKYCAQCNNEHNFTNWNLDIDCELFADFNFLSSYDEIIEEAKEKHCGIRYIPGSLPVHICPNETKYDTMIIDVCNTTGYWSKYDGDIAKACESTYDLKFRIFKNIFCYMCNPSKYYQKQIIAECNTTKMWQPEDKGLEKSCKYYKEEEGTKPFKNIFCYLCNKNNMHVHPYLDMGLRIFENKPFQTSNSYLYFVETLFFKAEYFLHLLFGNDSIDLPIMKGQSRSFSERVLPNEQRINITSLIRTHFAHGAKYEYCHSFYIDPERWFLQVFQQTCECDPYIIFNDFSSHPCISISLRYPSKCESNQILTKTNLRVDEKCFFITNGCFFVNSLRIFKEHCESGQADTIFDLLPVQLDGTKMYKNVFCSICNIGIMSKTELFYAVSSDGVKIKSWLGTPWDIDISCQNVLDFSHYVTFYNVLMNARDMGCKITFIPKENMHLPRPCEPTDSWVTSKCNITGYWSTYDKDIVWACEESDHDLIPKYYQFKNIFCEICNPDYTNSTVISSCNVTGLWKRYTPNLERACAIFPKVDTSFPYKNIFCKECNTIMSFAGPGGITAPPSTTVTTPTPKIDYPFTFRNIFSLSQYEEGTINDDLRNNCGQNQIYDEYMNSCRNVTCYPGKRLGNNSCNPLMKITSKLRYVMAFGMQPYNGLRNNWISSDSLNINYTYILTEIQTALSENLRQLLNITGEDVGFDSFTAFGNMPCNLMMTNISNIKILLNMNVFISGFVDRTETEKILMGLAGGNFIVTIQRCQLKSFKTKEALYLPTILQKADLNDNCFEGYSHYIYKPNNYFKSSYVDKVMLCKQVELDTAEFEVDAVKISIRLKYQNIDIEYDQYKIMPNGNARVCLDTLKFPKLSRSDDISTALSLLTVICVGISMLCLLIIFITYCIFTPLRTLPGKILMLLTFTIFLAQICFISGFRQIKPIQLCIARAVLSHLFWLATFCCMITCTLHMYRVFAKSMVVSSSLQDKNKIFRHYIYFSYGIPVLLCIANVIIHLLVSNGQSTGYGGVKCFINNTISIIVTFLIPVICICITNIVLFAVTAYRIRNTPKVQSNKSDRREFLIYVKMFTITGVLWILQIVDSFFPLSAFSFIVTILNGLQGLFLFLSYVCTTRVLEYYKTLLCYSVSHKTVSGSSFTSNSTATSEVSSSLPITRIRNSKL